MANAWLIALAALLCLTACRTAERKPVEVEMPVTERHFIVLGGESAGPGAAEAARARAGATGAGHGRMGRTN